MKNNIYKFYESKFKIFGLLLICVFLLFGSFLASQSIKPRERYIGYTGLAFFGVCLVMVIYKILSNKAFVEITPDYIKMYNFEKLFWADITGVQNVQIHNAKFFYFDVKDETKYKLTFWQKVNKMFGYSPFYISITTLSEKDLEELQKIIKQYVN